MTKKKTNNPRASKQAQAQGPRKPSFKSLLINYLLLVLAFYFLTKSCNEKKRLEAEKAKTEQTADTVARIQPPPAADSTVIKQLASEAGDFARAFEVKPQPPFTVENEVARYTFSPKGGMIRRVELKKYKLADGSPVVLLTGDNQDFNLDIPLPTGKLLSTRDLYFEPEVRRTDSVTYVYMHLPAGEGREFLLSYKIRPADYMVDMKMEARRLDGVMAAKPVHLHWEVEALAHESNPKYENQFTAIKYKTADGDVDGLSAMSKEKEKEVEDVVWVDFKQWFFSSYLINGQKPWDRVKLKQVTLFDKKKDTLHTKHFYMDTDILFDGGNGTYAYKWYHGPNDYKLLASYDMDLEKVIPLGWGIFGWINKYAFIPLFNFLKKFISNYGLIIILITLIVRLVTSPLYYKTYVSQAKTKIIKPEMDEINKKYKDNPMKRQQEIMKLQSKAGVNPMSGCLTSLLFIPIFYALFRFFPAEIDLRQKGFLWIKDLSAYETFIKLPFDVPLIGNHISLFALLAAVVMFFYMKMNQSGQSMSMPSQEGMPDMSKMMKWMLYLSPVMMFVFFNNYASGLSLYYFVSTLLSLIIVYVIKNYVIDEEKVRAQIEANKKKPRKQSKFQQRLQKMMEEAERQKQLQQQAKKRNK